jgi:hypothetical protein
MATTFAIKRPYFVTDYSDHHGLLGQEAPNQTFKRGALLSNDANGLLQATPVGAGALVPNVFADSDGQNSATPAKKARYVQSDADTVIEITAGGAAATAALLKRGAKYGYNVDGSGNPYMDLTNTTNLVFQIEVNGIVPGSGAIGDTNVRVWVKLIPAVQN